jgi:TonB family protein
VSGQGPVLNGERSGAWKFYRPDGSLATEETMLKDSAVAVRCFNADGTISTKDCFAERDADFPGGPKKWMEYISGKIQKHADYLIGKGAAGICVVLFVVDTNGKVTDARIKHSSGTILDKEALDVIIKSPTWIPAIQHNRPVKAFRSQPINFEVN